MTTGAIKTTLPQRAEPSEIVRDEPRVLEPRRIMSRAELESASRQLQEILNTVLLPGTHYGVIGGTQKPTLYLPGAVWLGKMFRLAPRFEVLPSSVSDWQSPLFSYDVRCTLRDMISGDDVAEGLGNCNSYEDKYRYRYAARTCPLCGAMETIIRGKQEFGGGFLCWKSKGGCGAKFADNDQSITSQPERRKVVNEEPYALVNTILKMAKKRAYVDAVLTATGAATLFTQDLEDFLDEHAGNAITGDRGDAPRAENAPSGPSSRPSPQNAHQRAQGSHPQQPSNGSMTFAERVAASEAAKRQGGQGGAQQPQPAQRQQQSGGDINARDAWERFNRALDHAQSLGLVVNAPERSAPASAVAQAATALATRTAAVQKYFDAFDDASALVVQLGDRTPAWVGEIEVLDMDVVNGGDIAVIVAETTRMIEIAAKLRSETGPAEEPLPDFGETPATTPV